jgi:hypothetical protein
MDGCIKLYNEYVHEKGSGTNALNVCITERSAHGAHCVTNRDRTRVCVSQRHRITELRGRRGRVSKRDGTVDGACAVRGVHILPGPPDAVDLRVVKVEPIRVSVPIPVQDKLDVTYQGSPGEVKKSEPGSPPTVK